MIINSTKELINLINIMELNPKQQIIELVKNSKKILLLTHARPDGDALGSILALYLTFKKIGKEVTAVCPDMMPKMLKFLPKNEELKFGFSGAKDFIISVNTSQVQIDKIGYKNNTEEHKLNIIITPKNGTLTGENVSFTEGGYKFDLIIVLDSSDLERLGEVYDKNPDLFYETPVVNIDHHAGNDHFGKVNWVDLTATSTAEILVALLESLGREKSLLDPDIATCLLTGIITDTGSFQHDNTTPKSFTVAAQLVAGGARQQEIIQQVFKTKTLSTLKLWGKILSKIKEEHEFRFVWSAISASDFIEAGASDDETSGVIDELLKTAPNIDFALLLSERKDGIHGSLRGVQKGVDVSDIARIFDGGGHELAAAFHIKDTTLDSAINTAIGQIRDWQRTKLSMDNPVQPKSDTTLQMPPIELL